MDYLKIAIFVVLGLLAVGVCVKVFLSQKLSSIDGLGSTFRKGKKKGKMISSLGEK